MCLCLVDCQSSQKWIANMYSLTASSSWVWIRVCSVWLSNLNFKPGASYSKCHARIWISVIVCLSKNIFISFNQIAFSNLNFRWKDPFFALPIINFHWRKPSWIINSVDVTSKQHLQWMNGLVFRIFLSVLVLFLGSILWVFRDVVYCKFCHKQSFFI